MEPLDRKIIAALQDELPLVAEPYKAIAEQLGITEQLLMDRLAAYRQQGIIRKIGAVLKHREVGYTANALCAWIVPERLQEQVGTSMASHPMVTHCYARSAQADWPYNFYTMLHAPTREQCETLAQELADRTGIRQYIMLFSTKEWKKASMRYFEENKA